MTDGQGGHKIQNFFFFELIYFITENEIPTCFHISRVTDLELPDLFDDLIDIRELHFPHPSKHLFFLLQPIIKLLLLIIKVLPFGKNFLEILTHMLILVILLTD